MEIHNGKRVLREVQCSEETNLQDDEQVKTAMIHKPFQFIIIAIICRDIEMFYLEITIIFVEEKFRQKMPTIMQNMQCLLN